MKSTRLANLLVLGLALGAGALGCRTSPQNVDPMHGHRENHVGENQPQLPPITGDTNILIGIPPTDPEKHKGWIRDPDKFKAQTVHFDLDSTVLKSSEKAKVAVVADYLKANATEAVEVGGHCDERGTEEYNRSLGERRALAVREDLVGLGIAPDRIDTISYGEDKPVATGHDESAWRQNRRGEFILLTPPPK
jgi:peptidoglycan-associated lipoprotein